MKLLASSPLNLSLSYSFYRHGVKSERYYNREVLYYCEEKEYRGPS